MYDHSLSCLICQKPNISTKRYVFNYTMWEDGLLHYISEHNIEPSLAFKKLIFHKDTFNFINDVTNKELNRSKVTHINTIFLKRVNKLNEQYVVINRNQLLILDALLIHGGYVKRYVGENNETSKYSEHAGLLDFSEGSLTKIIVSGKTERIDTEDDEIYMPSAMESMMDYEYIFHTHPPTPKPGGRANRGVLYEFPSIGDIYHFIDHYNEGNVVGSLVVTAEGLYNIRRLNNQNNNNPNINVNEDELYKKYQKTFDTIQKDAIIEYGTDFNTLFFYSQIAQNISYIDKLNEVLNLFEIQIDFYPRQKDKKGKWYIDTLFLVFRENKKNK
jgi:hypothetical protein